MRWLLAFADRKKCSADFQATLLLGLVLEFFVGLKFHGQTHIPEHEFLLSREPKALLTFCPFPEFEAIDWNPDDENRKAVESDDDATKKDEQVANGCKNSWGNRVDVMLMWWLKGSKIMLSRLEIPNSFYLLHLLYGETDIEIKFAFKWTLDMFKYMSFVS